MDSGSSSVEADLVVVATGVKSNMDVSGGLRRRDGPDGIKVDQPAGHRGRADIYAAGDCAQGPDLSTGGWSVQAIQPTASEHGRIAALNMAGTRCRAIRAAST